MRVPSPAEGEEAAAHGSGVSAVRHEVRVSAAGLKSAVAAVTVSAGFATGAWDWASGQLRVRGYCAWYAFAGRFLALQSGASLLHVRLKNEA